MKKRSFLVLGGDNRNLELANLLKKDGHNVYLSHVDGMNFQESSIIIGPLPLSYDGNTLNAPFHSEKIILEDILTNIKKDQVFIAGNVDNGFMSKAEEYGITVIDYFKRENMQVLNAVPTAEGAIKLAIEHLPITIHNSNTLVLGFGRIGKTLSKMLQGIGGNVYVAARNYSDIAWIKNYGYTPILFWELDKHIHKMDIVFNTVPAMVLDRDLLFKLNKEALIIDLASKPGGVDFLAAEELGIKTIHALGLPGKTAPVSAARIIKDTIYNILEERGI